VCTTGHHRAHSRPSAQTTREFASRVPPGGSPLPQKLACEAATWTQLQHSLYRYFAVIGGPLEVATIIAAVVFALRARVG
jgi:hypothetical protein